MMQAEWVASLVGGLVAGGVRDVVLSPGSRSTPLVLAIHANDALRVHDVIDERSAGFFALGLARTTQRTPLLVCTSGSAAGHYLPAIMEAAASFLPLAVLTADRPAELHDCGANQTVDQTALFGRHLRGFFELGAAHDSDRSRRGVAHRGSLAVLRSRSPRPGPVHLNVRLRKPFEETAAPHVHVARAFPPLGRPDPGGLRLLGEKLDAASRPLIAAGPASLGAGRSRELVAALAERLGAPVFADATSQLRFTGSGLGLPRSAAVLKESAPDADFVLQLGNAPIDAGWSRWVRGRPRAVLAEYGWPDPDGGAELVILGDRVVALRELVEGVTKARAPWWRAQPIAPVAGFGPGVVAQCVIDALPAGSLLMLGNSTVVRAVDRVVSSDVELGVLHQRGLSGIDGLISGAAGAVRGSGKPLTLLLGDVSALHDLGGLMLARDLPAPLTIVAINDDGGRIFEQLPIFDSLESSEFQRHFAMAHGLDFASVAAQFGLDYACVSNSDALRQELRSKVERSSELVSECARFIEVRVAPDAARVEATS